MTAENLASHGAYLSDIAELSATAYIFQRALHFLFPEPCKTIPKHTIVWDINGGSIMRESQWQAIPYAVGAKSIIEVNGELGPLHEFCGKIVQSVWARTFTTTSKGCGISVTPKMENGRPVASYWNPPPDISKEVVEALLSLGDIEAIYKFNITNEEHGTQLSPVGLIFRTTKKFSQKSKALILSMLPPEPQATS